MPDPSVGVAREDLQLLSPRSGGRRRQVVLGRRSIMHEDQQRQNARAHSGVVHADQYHRSEG